MFEYALSVKYLHVCSALIASIAKECKLYLRTRDISVMVVHAKLLG